MRGFRNRAPTSGGQLLAAVKETLEFIHRIKYPAVYEAQREAGELQRKLTVIWESGSPKEQATLIRAAEAAQDAPRREQERRGRRVKRLLQQTYTKAEDRAKDISYRQWEDEQVFDELAKVAPALDTLPSVHHPELMAISHFEPLTWITAPRVISTPEWRIRELRRQALQKRSTRLTRAVQHSAEVLHFVVPRLQVYQGRVHLSGTAQATGIVQFQLPAAFENLDGFRRRRLQRIGYATLNYPVRAHIPEIALNPDDTTKLPLGLRRFLDDPQRFEKAHRAGILDLSGYLELTTVKPATPKDDLADMLQRLGRWGYPEHLVQEEYIRLNLSSTLSLSERTARLADAVDMRRAKVEEEIRKQAAVVGAAPVSIPTDDEESLEIPQDTYVIWIGGPVGMGKTAVGQEAIEKNRDRATPYVVLHGGMERPASLPPWIRTSDNLESIPPGSMILLDEAPLAFSARESGSTAAKLMMKWIGLVRQRRQVLLVVSRLGSEIDKVLMAHSDLIVVKKPLAGTSTFERPLLRSLLDQAEAAFARIEGDPRCYSYVWNRRTGTKCMLRNGLPSFWTDELSRCFASASLTAAGSGR